MISEEFTFPIITSNNVVHLTVLPPLWRVNQSDSHLQENGRDINKRKVIFTSFSRVEGEIVNRDNNNMTDLDPRAEAEAQEKMDMLWEDFNEEENTTATATATATASDSHEMDYTNNDFHLGELEIEDDGCNNIVNESERPCRKRKKQLDVVGKMMKKLFWLHNMAKIKKRGPTSN